MRINIVIDDELTKKAFALTGLKTKRELVNAALEALVKRESQKNEPSLCDAFKSLHDLVSDDEPFPSVPRQNRNNPFANQL